MGNGHASMEERCVCVGGGAATNRMNGKKKPVPLHLIYWRQSTYDYYRRANRSPKPHFAFGVILCLSVLHSFLHAHFFLHFRGPALFPYPKMDTSLHSISSWGTPIPAFSNISCLNSFILEAALPTSNKIICGLPSTSQRPQCTRYLLNEKYVWKTSC